MRNLLILLAIALLSFNVYSQNTTEGTLYAISRSGSELGSVPLKDTKVTASITGFVARVNVRQEFINSFAEAIEAVYTFPLSQNGAVDSMTMTIGPRTIRGKIMKREEAREVYEAARSAGKSAALLDQERPNIFTQAVANIMPGESIIIEISYVEMLKYEDGQYEFVFPMVVGPRYVPGSVRDAANLTPPVAASRAGHDISIEVNINSGVPVESIRSTSHDIQQINVSPAIANVSLQNEKTIPNKDFILRYDVTGKRIEDAVLTHRSQSGGFFSLILQPPDMPAVEDRTPKEIVFVLDTSGSMYGFPIEKAKEAMLLSLDGLYPEDTFNLITFAGSTQVLFDGPVPATRGNLDRAKEFLASHHGGGGTEMMTAIKAALSPSSSPSHLRIVCFMTDGYIGNEDEIIAEIQRHPNARVFSFGIGNSVNRFLLDKMAEAGKGEAEYVSLNDDGSKAARKFYERIRSPLLTDLSIDWNGMPVSDVYPTKLGDLFSAKPVIVNGRFARGARGTIKLKGKLAGQPYVREIAVDLPEAEPANDVLATLWARKRIDQLSSDALKAKNVDEVNAQITNLGLEFRLLTQFTSFVAVEDQIVNHNGTPTRVEVPVEIPDGVNPETTVGGAYNKWLRGDVGYIVTKEEKRAFGFGSGSGSATGSGRGGGGVPSVSEAVTVTGSTDVVQTSSASIGNTISGPGVRNLPVDRRAPLSLLGMQTGAQTVSAGVLNGKATTLPKPGYPAAARAVRASGTVTVQVVIDETGKVASANAVSGHPLLRAAAEKAAAGSEYTPTMMSGQPVRVAGVITYNFVNPNNAGNVKVTPGELIPEQEQQTPEMVREHLIKDKLHTWVYSLYNRLRTGVAEPDPTEASFVKDGRANLTIVLEKRTSTVIQMLKAAGFTITDDSKGTTLTGHIESSKIGALADLSEVKLIRPR